MDENNRQQKGDDPPNNVSANRGKRGGDESIRETLPLLQPPSSDEAKAYYRGLPSMPRLVGRTSAGIVPCPPPLPQPLPNHFTSPTKLLGPVGRHCILECWETTVREKILHALGNLDWTTVDVVRIGYDNVPVLERPVVVWVGVANTAHQWNPTVCEALRGCRKVLDQAGLLDVECEIRVSEVRHLALPRPQLLDRPYKTILYPISTNIGTSMCPAQVESHVGSLCIYISLAHDHNGTGPLWALTCRHVALPKDVYPTDKTYKWTNTSQPAIKINSPASKDLQNECKTIKFRISVLKAQLNRRPEDKHFRNILSMEEDLLSKLKPFEPAICRLAGSVFAAPIIEQAEYWGEGREAPYLWSRDWCLVELDRQRFPNNAADLTNRVYLMSEDGSDDDLNRRLNPNNKNRNKFKFPADGYMQLSGVIPMAEIRNPESLNVEGQECFIVGKRGSATKLTWGCPSEIMSTLRTVLDGEPAFETREWAIVSSLGSKTTAFSKGGDSGSLIFGIDGRLGGILTRGTRFGLDSDITYVTPMEVVLADIEQVLGLKVKVL
ncbi:hypothetical protein F503_00644 [Ophiostoma piceae UAMH 11346]|uniref:Uncharacterized protein n=1 Tax=Ophiostoma piceae (strain UAMH 11346) TaxID=1262450 RepID=S3C551_OPHP1|nr:hypothetical protein F503_00644 [Ophiostoma piceae UAMH 11346]